MSAGEANDGAAPRVCPRCGSNLAAGVTACAKCLLDESADESLRVGSLELGELLGRGGMGEVYRAHDVRLGRDVAVKFLPEAIAATADGRARFEREARALALLNHPNIVTLYEFGESDGQPYLVMELVDGKPLPGRLPLPRAEALAIAVQVCDALAYAHDKGLVHRDVKPANVLVDAKGRVKLTDFGIARLAAGHAEALEVRRAVGDAASKARAAGGARSEEPARRAANDAKAPIGAAAHDDAQRRAASGSPWTLTAANVVAGTPQYVAPEALQGAAPDPRMDIFSVGVLVYELCTGKLPMGDFAPLDGPLDRVVRKALAQDPLKRHADIRALKAELESAARASPSDQLPEDERIWIRTVAMISAIAAALVFFAGMTMLTPRVTTAEDLGPLIALTHETLPDGRVVSRARFEMWPTVAAGLGLVAMFAAYALLRRHWRQSGLDTPRPDSPVEHAWWVAAAGLGACALYGVRRLLEGTGLVAPTLYIPAIGGVFELWVVFLVFVVLLEVRRRARPLIREPLLYGGAAIALIPPVIEFVSFLRRWTP